MHVEDSQLRQFLLDSDLVTRAEFDAAEKEGKEKGRQTADILVSSGKISEDDLRRVNAYILGVPFVNLKGTKIPADTLALIPEPIARTHNIAAYSRTERGLEVAMLDVQDLSAIDFLKKKLDLKILPRLTDAESIKVALLQYQKSLKAEFGDLIGKEAAALKTYQDGFTGEESDGRGIPSDLKKLAEDLPVVRIVDSLLKHAIVQSASDIHIEPLEKEVLVRYRIDGLLRDAMSLPRDAAASIAARIKVLASLKIDEKRLPQDGRFKLELEGDKVSVRVSILPTYFGEKIVMRLLREGHHGFTLDALGFEGRALEQIHKALKLSSGMILATGPTGSGKTTTLYTLLDMLNTPDVNISTIEDPIEYQMPRINQTQVRPDIGLTFGNGLRSLVRQDPDILMVGEIRDEETAALSVNAALTGHLVLSTLHTNSASGAVPRLVDLKIEPFLLSSTLSVIIAQRLVRTLCSDKESHILSKEELAELGEKADLKAVLAHLKEEKIVPPEATWEKIPFYRPKMSAECEDGYKGRIGIHEVLPVTPSLREKIAGGASGDIIEKEARAAGMLTMLEEGIVKAARGVTSIEEVLRAVTTE
ncbi:GspE/PulE family protein [Candidatus Parcubacteria bacterium]|nr:GspE/PulE family protein [Candidatus Parcubacteria bacterium]